MITLKKFEEIHSLQSFQNGGSALSEIPSRTRQFDMQDRSQGGIFFQFPSTKTLESLSDFNGQATYINFFAYVLSSSKNFYKIIKS